MTGEKLPGRRSCVKRILTKNPQVRRAASRGCEPPDSSIRGFTPPARRTPSLAAFADPLGAQRADDGAGPPHLAVGHLLQLLFELPAVVGAAVRLQHAARLLAGGHTLVQLLEHRAGGVAEALEPVQ